MFSSSPAVPGFPMLFIMVHDDLKQSTAVLADSAACLLASRSTAGLITDGTSCNTAALDWKKSIAVSALVAASRRPISPHSLISGVSSKREISAADLKNSMEARRLVPARAMPRSVAILTLSLGRIPIRRASVSIVEDLAPFKCFLRASFTSFSICSFASFNHNKVPAFHHLPAPLLVRKGARIVQPGKQAKA